MPKGKHKQRSKSNDNSSLSARSSGRRPQLDSQRNARTQSVSSSTRTDSDTSKRSGTFRTQNSIADIGASRRRSDTFGTKTEAELSNVSRSDSTNLPNERNFHQPPSAPFQVLNQKELGAVLAGSRLPTFLMALQTNISNPLNFERQNQQLLSTHDPVNSVATDILLTMPGTTDLAQVEVTDTSPPLGEADKEALERDQAILKECQSAIQDALTLLGPDKEGDFLTEAKIGALLASNTPGDRPAGIKVMAALLKVSRAPKIIAAGFQAAGILSGNEALSQNQLQTSFIKWSRSNLTNIYFKSALMADLHQAIPNIPIGHYIANIGFNRLMSGENLLGASLSSDIDFKLVLDDKALASELADYETDETVDTIAQKIREVLEGTQKEFEENFELTLEVEGFTVKTLGDVEKQMEESEQERNFSATVINNQTLMSGNAAVQQAYKAIIRARVGSQIAQRCWTQNLGESDKGSLKVIEALPVFEAALGLVGQVINADAKLKILAFELMFTFKGISEIIKLNNKPEREFSDMVSDPNLLKYLLKDTDFKTLLLNNKKVNEALNNVAMFDSQGNDKKIDLIAKLTGSFTVDNNTVLDGVPYINNRNFIGRSDVTIDKEWVYSVKFSANRLYDNFDQTLVDDYVSAHDGNQRAQLVKKYSEGRKIAEALNKFAVQLQDRTYNYQSEMLNASHQAIDHVYDRITATEFARILQRPHQKQAFLTSLRTLIQDLQTPEIGVSQNMQQEIKKETKIASQLIDEFQKTQEFNSLKDMGFKLFRALSSMATKTAAAIEPK
jgi:hypothetical protein